MIRNFGFWTLLVALCLFSMPALAEDGDLNVAVLDVPGGGTELLTKGIDEIDGVVVRDQKWFLGEITSRGISPKRILRRTKDLKWVIKGANIKIIVYLAKSEDETKYDVGLMDESGTNAKEFQVDVTESGLSEPGVKLIVAELRGLLKKPEASIALVEETPVEPVTEEPDPEDLDPAEQRKRALAEEERLKARLTKDWLVASISGRIFSRELMVTSPNGNQLSYSSAPYPGVELKAEAFPGAFADPEYADIGFILRFATGFGSVESTRKDPMLHIDAEVGPLFRLVSPLGQEGGTTSVRAQAKATVRYTSFVVDSQALPETSLIAPTIGASVAYPVFAPDLLLRVTSTWFRLASGAQTWKGLARHPTPSHSRRVWG
ncbi:MAG: hypothetical protein R3E66_13980 [bacterium]